MRKKVSAKPKPNHKGVMRNDLEGSMCVKGNKIYVRYKGKDYSTGYDNTPIGWTCANMFWEAKLQQIQAQKTAQTKYLQTIGYSLERFLDYQKNIKRIKKRSVSSQYSVLNLIFNEHKNENLTAENLELALENYYNNKTAKLKDASINSYLINVKTFINWAVTNELLIKKDYTKKYRRPKSSKMRASYSEDEYKLIINSIGENQKHLSLLIQFLWHTGARVGEAIDLNVEDIDFEKSIIRIPNKIFKGQEESLILSDIAKNILLQAIELQQKKGYKKLFLYGNATTAILALSNVERKIGIKIPNRCMHGFRRSYADRLLSNPNISIVDAQDIMRHRNINVTLQHYKNLNKEKLVEKLNKIENTNFTDKLPI